MAAKCVHKGCGKTFTDDNEDCIYHPGPPVFHEGQKGWACCKPRVLTFDEFLSIPPCTTGKHSTVDDTPAPEPKPAAAEKPPDVKPISNGSSSSATLAAPAPRLPQALASESRAPASPAPPESDSDEPSATIPAGLTCKRRGCTVESTPESSSSRESEECVYHPGQALFHEGSKGWTCCKKRVLEFDEFMKIPGCKTRSRHCFLGKKGTHGKDTLEKLDTVRHDFYQTPTAVHASVFLKKIDKAKSSVEFAPGGEALRLDLKTTDGKWYATTMPLHARIKPEDSAFRILGTKLELTLAKADGAGWPVLRADEKPTGEIIQTGRAGVA